MAVSSIQVQFLLNNDLHCEAASLQEKLNKTSEKLKTVEIKIAGIMENELELHSKLS